jgi:predicted transposase YdaD
MPSSSFCYASGCFQAATVTMPAELSNPHDRFFKEIWSRESIGQDFLRHYLPQDIVDLLDLDSLELTKDSFVDRRLRQHYSDLLYRLKFKDGRPGFVYILLEHKRAPKRSTALQLLRYRVQIWEKTLAQGVGTGGLPPIIPVVLYQGDTPWPYGETFQQLFHLPASLAPYTPEFRYALCDLTGLADTDIRGAVLLRVTLWIMKPIADAQLAERLPGIVRLLRELSEQRTLLDYLETLLRYLTTATDKLSERAIGQALNEVLPLLEEKFMPTLAEKWLEQGRQEAHAEMKTLAEKWLEQGRQEGLTKGQTKGIQAGERRVLLRQCSSSVSYRRPSSGGMISMSHDIQKLFILW